MSDNKRIKGPKDQDHVNIHETYEVEYWTSRFQCTSSELRQAVKDAGSTQKDKVKAQLDKNRRR